MIKKIIAFCACAAMVLSFAACSDVEEDKNLDSNNNAATDPVSDDSTDPEGGEESSVKIVDGEIDTIYYDIEVGDSWDITTGSDTMVMLSRKGETEEERASNISVMYTDQFGGMTADECLDALVEQYEEMDSYDVVSSESKKIGENDACEVVLSSDLAGKTAIIKQICVLDPDNSANGAILTFTALSDYYDATVEEVDEMAASIEFDE